MGDTSVNDLKDDVEVTDDDQTELETEGQEVAEGEEGQEEEAPEIEIVLAGDEGSQPENQSNLGIRKRVNKLNAKVSAAVEGESQANAELETMRQKNELLQLALEQQNAAPAKPSGPPDPFDFDDGAKDAKYVDALKQYNRDFFQAEMAADPRLGNPLAG